MIHVVLVLLVVGFLLWLFNSYVTKIDGTMKGIINAVVIICVVVWLLNVFGVFAHDVPVPRIR